MSDDIDIGRAGVVLELEADLVLFRCALPQRDLSEHPALWARTTKRLWGKIFIMSEADGRPILWSDPPRARPERPPMPERLAEEIAGISSARQAAIHLFACASVAVSDQADGREAEAERLRRSVLRYLETPEGQDQRARVNQSLAGDLRVSGLEVRSLE